MSDQKQLATGQHRTANYSQSQATRSDGTAQRHPARGWVAGFLDGDGCLRLDVSKRDQLKIGYQVTPMITITQAAGLTDADGCIALDIERDTNRPLNYRPRPKYSLSQAGHNAVALGALEEFFNDLGVHPIIQKDPREDHQDAWELRITGVTDVERALSPLRDHLIVKYQQAVILLDKIIPLLRADAHTEQQGFLQLIAWKDRMDKFKGGERGGYTLDFFESEFGLEYDSSYDVFQSQLSSFMPQRVFTYGGRGSQSVFHVDRSCPRLNGDDYLEMSREKAEQWGRQPCTDCTTDGDDREVNNSGPQLAAKLANTDKDSI